eukprot:scaffold892_cov164-Pinguiococcus_pyrenoidosus.AAC.4
MIHLRSAVNRFSAAFAPFPVHFCGARAHFSSKFPFSSLAFASERKVRDVSRSHEDPDPRPPRSGAESRRFRLSSRCGLDRVSGWHRLRESWPGLSRKWGKESREGVPLRGPDASDC